MSSVRFIHTSDIHLDTSFSGSGFPSRIGDRKREAIRSTFRRILEEAREREVDLVLIAGDLFEHDRVLPDTLEYLKQQFARLAPIRVFISPGNHDPWLEGSPYREETWPSNVHIFATETFETVTLPEIDVRVTGFGYNRTQLEERLFQRLPVLPGGGTNIVIAHGSDTGRVPAGKHRHGPLTIEEIAGKNVHYCALGHYHQQRPVDNPIDGTQVWYCGIPEGRGWDEEGDLGYLMIEVKDGHVRVEPRTSNQYPLRTLPLECDGYTSREQIVEAILAMRGSHFDARTILRVRLQGSVDPRLDLSFGELQERLADEALHIAWENRTTPALDFEALARGGTLVARFVSDMNSRISAAPDKERAMLERARLYGVQALLGREVRLR